MANTFEYEANLIHRVLSRRPYAEDVLAIDRRGTIRQDDFIRYESVPGKPELVTRSVHVIDMPSLVHHESNVARIALKSFFDEKRLFPNSLTIFPQGSVFPTIKFALTYNQNTGDVVGFNIAESSARFKYKFSRLDIDNLRLRKPEHQLIQNFSKDPALRSDFHDILAGRFSQTAVGLILMSTNSLIMDWAEEIGVPLIYNNKNRAASGFNYSIKKEDGAVLTATCPGRNFVAYVNLCNIDAAMRGLPTAFESDELYRIAKKATKIAERKNNDFQNVIDKYPKPTEEQITKFMTLLVDRSDYPSAQRLLEANGRLSRKALLLLGKDKKARFCSLSRIGAVQISGEEEFSAQVTIVKNGITLRGPVVKGRTEQAFEAEILAAKAFWREFFNDPKFQSPEWREREDLFEKKKAVDEQMQRKFRGGGRSEPSAAR